MSLAFYRALALTLQNEGDYSDDPVDHGGATKWGITQATYDNWRMEHGLPIQPVRLLERSEMERIYEEDYWIPAHCNELPMGLAACHFDAFVNHRPQTAMRLLQTAVDATPDGRWGPQTWSCVDIALRTVGEKEVIKRYLDARSKLYDRIVMGDPSQERFRRGWQNRILALSTNLASPAVA